MSRYVELSSSCLRALPHNGALCCVIARQWSEQHALTKLSAQLEVWWLFSSTFKRSAMKLLFAGKRKYKFVYLQHIQCQ